MHICCCVYLVERENQRISHFSFKSLFKNIAIYMLGNRPLGEYFKAIVDKLVKERSLFHFMYKCSMESKRMLSSVKV